MWNLEYELIAILILAAIIGVLMGRFLCKSGETEERLEKEKVITAFKSIKHDLIESQDRFEEQSSIMMHQKERISILEQDNSNFQMQLNSSEAERQKLLEELKELEKYRSRFEALSQEFDFQSQQVESIKSEKAQQLEEIESQKTNINVLEHALSELESKHAKVEAELDQALEVNRKEQQKLKEVYHLNDISMTALNDMTDQREQLSEELKEKREESKRLGDLLHEREEDFALLEKEFAAYKQSFNIDDERLSYLEKEFETLSQNFNTVLTDRDDLLSRIRAISSVVGAVGVNEE